jgi:hypothetical protein
MRVHDVRREMAQDRIEAPEHNGVGSIEQLEDRPQSTGTMSRVRPVHVRERKVVDGNGVDFSRGNASLGRERDYVAVMAAR